MQQIVYFKITAHLKNLHYYYYYYFFLYKFIRPISLDIRLGRVPQRNLQGLLVRFFTGQMSLSSNQQCQSNLHNKQIRTCSNLYHNIMHTKCQVSMKQQMFNMWTKPGNLIYCTEPWRKLMKWKKVLGETQTLCAGCSKNFRPAVDPLPGGAGRPKLNQLDMVTTLPTNLVWWKSMHAILSYHGNRSTNPHPHTNRRDQ